MSLQLRGVIVDLPWIKADSEGLLDAGNYDRISEWTASLKTSLEVPRVWKVLVAHTLEARQGAGFNGFWQTMVGTALRASCV